MIIEEIKVGMEVLYIPEHAFGDRTHPDCERGVVSRTDYLQAWVRYYRRDGSGLSHTAQPTTPDDLVKV